MHTEFKQRKCTFEITNSAFFSRKQNFSDNKIFAKSGAKNLPRNSVLCHSNCPVSKAYAENKGDRAKNICTFTSAARIHSHGRENTKMTGRPHGLSVNKTTQAPSLAVSCACHLLARSRESPPNCAPAKNWESLCCSLTTEATRVDSNTTPQGKTSPRMDKSAQIGTFAKPSSS